MTKYEYNHKFVIVEFRKFRDHESGNIYKSFERLWGIFDTEEEAENKIKYIEKKDRERYPKTMEFFRPILEIKETAHYWKREK